MVTAEFVSSLAGVLLSLVFSYVPGAKQWYGALDGMQKRLVMLAFLVLAVALVLVTACSGFGADFNLAVMCDRSGLVSVMKAFGAAVIANQTTYLISPPASKG